MAPSVKVTYFAIKALGEPIRLLLSYGGMEFEDERIEFADWPNVKPTMPFGQVPTYEEDGKTATQSVAISRYLGKKFKLAGADDWEDLEIDAIADTVVDLRLKIRDYHLETDPTIKEQRKTVIFDETLPFYLNRLEQIAKSNGGHLAAGKLTWADFYLAGTLDVMNFITQKDITDGYPNIKAVQENVFSQPGVKEWVQNRPKTNM